jgi:hypothetical protein
MAIEPGPQFYHGTSANFNPGDIIQPREVTGAKPNFDPEPEEKHEINRPEFNSGSVAYATDTPDSALFSGSVSAQNAKLHSREAKVYQVEPMNHEDVSPNVEGSIWGVKAFSSKSGFRVVKRHGDG